MTDPHTTAPVADDLDRNRTVRVPDDLWEALERAAQRETSRLGSRVTKSDLVRQGAAQRVRDILGETEGGA